MRARALSTRHTRSCAVMPGCHRQAQGLRPAISERLFAPVHACRCCGLPSPCQSAPGSPSLGSIYRRSRPRITTRYTYDKRSAYLSPIAAWHVDNSGFLCMHRMRLALSQVKALLWLRPGSVIPSISTMCAQARRRCAQVIHMFVHRQQGSSPLAGLAGRTGSARRYLPARPARRMGLAASSLR